MTPFRLAGIALAVIGAVLMALGVNAANAPVNDLVESMTGQYSDRIVLQFAGGTAALVVGLIMMRSGR